MDGIMRNEYYVDTEETYIIIHQEIKAFVTNRSKWGMSPSILPKLWQNGLGTTMLRYWSGHHKALTTIHMNICETF